MHFPFRENSRTPANNKVQLSIIYLWPFRFKVISKGKEQTTKTHFEGLFLWILNNSQGHQEQYTE